MATAGPSKPSPLASESAGIDVWAQTRQQGGNDALGMGSHVSRGGWRTWATISERGTNRLTRSLGTGRHH
jgi:hypothetical protein